MKTLSTKRVLTPEKALGRAQDICARAEHSSGEIRKKLANWGIFSDDAEKIISQLEDTRFIDDHRFASAYAIDKMRFARWGKRKIQMGLRSKGIALEISRVVIDSLPQDEYIQILVHLLQAKAKNDATLINTFEGRTRLYRFAMQRGYETPLIAKCIKRLMSLAESS